MSIIQSVASPKLEARACEQLTSKDITPATYYASGESLTWILDFESNLVMKILFD